MTHVHSGLLCHLCLLGAISTAENVVLFFNSADDGCFLFFKGTFENPFVSFPPDVGTLQSFHNQSKKEDFSWDMNRVGKENHTEKKDDSRA